jgi:hypothetical protein
MATKERFGYASIFHKEKEDIIKLIEEYNPVWYIIGMETCKTGEHKQTGGEHFHFIYDMKDNDHEAFKKQLIRKYNLGSKNNKQDKPYYGFPKTDIKDTQKLKAYTIKDMNYVSKGISDEEIKNIEEISFPKEQKDDIEDYCEYLNSNLAAFQLVDEYDEDYNLINARYDDFDFREMENMIFRYYKQKGNKKVMTYHKLHHIGSHYLQNYHPTKEKSNLTYMKKRF